MQLIFDGKATNCNWFSYPPCPMTVVWNTENEMSFHWKESHQKEFARTKNEVADKMKIEDGLNI